MTNERRLHCVTALTLLCSGVLVEAIYEPPQEGFATHFVLNDQDPQVGRADAIAMLLGMQRVSSVRASLKLS